MNTTATNSKETELAGITSRILASLIDLSIGIAAVFSARVAISLSPENPLSSLAVSISVGILLGVIAYQAFCLSATGQTVGKRLMRLRVVNFSDAGNPGFARSVVIRWWLLCLIYPIPYLGWVFTWLMRYQFSKRTDAACMI